MKKKPEEKVKKEFDPNKNIFDFLKVLFVDPVAYSKLTDVPKQKFVFYVNRLMSIYYPRQSAYFSQKDFNSTVICDFWHRTFKSQKMKSLPLWVYTNLGLTAKKEFIEVDTISYYKKIKKIETKEYKQLERLFPEELKQELINLQERLKNKPTIQKNK